MNQMKEEMKMTNEIIKRKANEILTKADHKKTETSSLLDLFKRKDSKKILLIDVSTSMSDLVGNRSKFQIMQDILSNDLSGYRSFTFASHCEEVRFNQLPKPHGSTNMAMAFYVVKREDPDSVILITDGCPDSEALALEASKGLKINIIYIGPDPVPDFLRKLANLTEGNFDSVNMFQRGSQLLLKSKIKGLLG